MKIEKLFLRLAIPFLLISIFVMPVTKVPDEATHAFMSWNILFDSPTSRDTEAMNELRTTDFAYSKPEIHAVDSTEYSSLFTKIRDFSKDKLSIDFSLKSLMSTPQLIGLVVGKLLYPSYGMMVTIGRLFNTIVYIIGIYYLIKKIKYGKMTLFFVSLLPMMIQQAGSLSYDVVNYLAVVAFFVFYVNLLVDKVLTTRKFIKLILLSLLLYLTKANNILLLALLFFVDFEFEGVLSKFNSLLKWIQKRRLPILILGFGLVLLVSYLFLHNRGGVVHFVKVMINSLFINNRNDHLNGILTVGIFGYFGWFVTQLPLWLIFIDIFIFTLLLFNDGNLKISKTEGLASLFVLPVQVAIIVAGMYFAWTPTAIGPNAIISQGAQGRYFTPFLVYLFPACLILKEQVSVSVKQKYLIRLITGTVVINFIMYLFLIVDYYWL
ncbi:TPA: DUF2142 domain-containing protein [Streptococcus suis]|uniref:DUF2142 domain-containing protein n=1 Tax=Streptococcus suis TaxID=1307 RepID=UPI0005CF6FAF|nr:DUF2142 domain-containing protein [Streptococcus suis]MCK3948971.1 DUF2142 domain-containing protein [Streptococcus suis]MCK3973633.1 DUF2142 domain-containing protein [Streptococcus suis]MEE3813869.1 DUF2142 domain-containing protein [Streptococcus suis]NQJ15676.1 DUF2142 domain-containing protein [Streptococcus suis]NQJ43595.1 DUF2142 domain-containing protein [Streptococcus suis]